MMHTSSPKRKVLYYPTILIPPSWLKLAILYWDKVSSIVPDQWEDKFLLKSSWNQEAKSVMEFLEKEGEFTPVRPSTLLNQEKEWANVDTFEREFKEIVKSQEIRENVKKSWIKNSFWWIKRDKISKRIHGFLETRNLTEKSKQHRLWFKVETNTALLYMALLAKYLADIDFDYTFPATNHLEYEDLIYGAKDNTKMRLSLNIKFINILPEPKEDVSLQDILEFKRNRKDELFHFRETMDDLHGKISLSNSEEEIKETIIQYREKLEREIINLRKVMKDSNIQTVLGVFKTLMDIKSPTMLEAIGLSLSNVPPPVSVPIIAITAAIQVGYYCIDKRNSQRAIMRQSPFAYLYHAKETEIVEIMKDS